MGTSAALAPFRARPADAAVVVDFDGTLSPIVDDPAAARAAEGAAEALVALAGRLGHVGVMAGRRTDFLRAGVPAGVVQVLPVHGVEHDRVDVVRVSLDRGDRERVPDHAGSPLRRVFRVEADEVVVDQLLAC